ncbi:MAG: YkgJ family cysteine cluster protein [Polyangiaceae bacterium]
MPTRPRLADHAAPRRHFIDGEEVVVVHDMRTGDLVRMPPRAWALVQAADGTRDLGGLMLAASQSGELRRTSEIVSVLTDLQAAGMLTDGIDPFAREPGEAAIGPETPLDVLPFRLTCDGSGACCATYSTVRFTEAEAERARVLVPEAQGGRGRVFLPLAGSGAQASVAATAIDGACAFLAGDGACEIHKGHGLAAKPSGCAIYPATFVFDGERVRVSLGVECGCVARSVGREEGVPLVAEGAVTRADLPEGAQIVAIPEVVEIATGLTAPREEVVRWSRAAMRLPVGGDAVAILWALAAAVEKGDLSEAGVNAALSVERPPSAEALAPWVEAVAARTAEKRDSADRWRSARDRVRVGSQRLAEAAAHLREPGALDRLLAANSSEAAKHGVDAGLERFYVTASLHGHALIGDVPLAHALRDRAVRILLARALGERAAGAGGAETERVSRDREEALPLVEAMMRAQGVKEYARLVPQ